MPGWKWISIIVLSTTFLVRCGTATSPPTAAPFSSPTVPFTPTALPQGTPTAQQTYAPTSGGEIHVSTETPAVNETMTPSSLLTPTRGDQLSSDPILAQLVLQARADLARRLGLSAESFQLKRAEAVEWPDTSLGCPRPGLMYAQVITPGYLIVLGANNREYEYHSDSRRVFLCEK
jgi:hypothetical protein